MKDVITEEAARAIIRAGGFPDPDTKTVRDIAFTLDAAARAFILDYHANRRDKRRRLRTRPKKEARLRLHGDLEGAWQDLLEAQKQCPYCLTPTEETVCPECKKPRPLPSVRYSKREYYGPYVSFVRAFDTTVADYIEQHTTAPLWRGLVDTLRKRQGSVARSNPVSLSFKARSRKILEKEVNARRSSLPAWIRTLAK